MAPSEYLGQTIDLFNGPNVTPGPTRRVPDTLRRRGRLRWRRLPQ